jgi:hypothetical protein
MLARFGSLKISWKSSAEVAVVADAAEAAVVHVAVPEAEPAVAELLQAVAAKPFCQYIP